MLPQFFRIVVVNNSGQTVTFNGDGRFNLKMTGWYIVPATGLVAYTQLTDDDLSFIAGDSVVNGGEEKSDEIDNTATKYIGMTIQLEVIHDAGAAADGLFNMYLDGGDATGELATDASGYAGAKANGLEWINALIWESNGLNDEVMRSPARDI